MENEIESTINGLGFGFRWYGCSSGVSDFEKAQG